MYDTSVAYDAAVRADALAEMINIGAGRAAAALSELVGARVVLEVPQVRLAPPSCLAAEAPELADNANTAVVQVFEGLAQGRAALVVPRQSSLILARLLGGSENSDDEFTVEVSGVMAEVGNIVLNAVLGSIGNLLETELRYTVPQFVSSAYTRVLLPADERLDSSGVVLVADAKFSVAERQLEGALVILLNTASLNLVVRSLLATSET